MWATRPSPTLRTAESPKRMAMVPALDRGEVRRRQVDVGHQHLDAHLPALVEVDGGLVLVVLDAGEQRSEVLDRVVRLQVGGLVADEP
jgi:hypothetical protein